MIGQRILFVKNDKFKLSLIFYIIVFIFATINIRLFYIYFANKTKSIQINEGSNTYKYPVTTSDNNYVAITLKSNDLYIDPSIVVDKKQTMTILKDEFNEFDSEDFLNRLEKKSWILIKRNISDERFSRLIQKGLVGIRLDDSYKRSYPDDNLFSHIVGYSNLNGGGYSGLEKYYNNNLYEQQLDISIDKRVQTVLREELVAGMKTYDAKGAFGIIMEVQTGEVVATVSLPDFNPNESINPNDQQMQNKVTAAIYNLGSVFKFFTLAYALENGIEPERKFYVGAGLRVESGKIIKDVHNDEPYLTLNEIFYKSSNVGSGLIALMFGRENYVNFLDNLGIFTKPETNLPDGEIARPIFNKKDLSMSRIVTTSFGYGVSMSPLQFLAIANGIVNKGIYVKPTFIKNGNRGIVGRRVVSEETSKIAIEIANHVVTEGTARRASVKGYKICGKTGTSNKFDNETKSWSEKKKFVSFFSIFPCSEPRFVMYVGFDEPHPTKESGIYGYADLYGGTVAAPVTSKVISVISPLLNIKADNI